MQKQQLSKVARFVIRWGIAVFGIWYVIIRMSWSDRVLAILPPPTTNPAALLSAESATVPIPQSVALVSENATEEDPSYTLIDPATGKQLTLPRTQIVNAPDRAKLPVMYLGKQEYIVGLDLRSDLKSVRRVLLATTPTSPTALWVPPAAVPDYQLSVPHPRVQVGVIRMIRHADVRFLLAALAVFPITILITSFRWHELMKALDIQLTLSRTFILNMVGLFYNTFMPGSTGGDLLKAYYVAKQTHHRTRAVMSVLVDRVIGLIALIILGGTMAALQWHIPMCRRVAIGSALIITCVAIGCLLFYVPILSRISGLNFLIRKLPMQRQVQKAVETMHIYGRRPGLSLGALVVSFPVHAVVILAAMLSGFAFGLPVHPFYYWMAVPVIVLAGSIPISPQGAGVMEYFAIKLLEPQNVSVSQAFALTMSIRLVQIFWNLSGGYFVLRGGYHAPTDSEQKAVEADDDDDDDSPELPGATAPVPA